MPSAAACCDVRRGINPLALLSAVSLTKPLVNWGHARSPLAAP
jgi:hypothetical protein